MEIQRKPIFLPETGNPRFPTKVAAFCPNCGEVFQLKSPRAIYCETCRPIVERRKSKERWIKNGRKQTSAKNWKYVDGKKVYVKSGYHQAGENNNAYKNGTGIDWFAKAMEILPHKCNRCGKTEDEENYKVRNLLLHHKDGNHNNNSPDNWEILCKQCHQKHHCKRGSDGRFVSHKG